ncbi:MAG: DNA-3-methyladenine glycosylase 2 family protein [Actinobacteria bacterium]|nr:DNA-3-methyladenine glycosylase 2 family protein [Actinomycetota bacterium]
MTSEATRTYRPGHPLAVGAILGCYRHGGGDPTFRRDEAGIWLGRHTPEGPGTMVVCSSAADGAVIARAWGSGGDWLLDGLPDLLGASDDWSGFVAHHPQVAAAWAANPGWRVPRSRLVIDSLVPAVIEQKVTGKEAFAAYRTLVWRFGASAPGPNPGLRLAPTAAQWAAIPSWEFLRAGVTSQRADTVMRCVQRAGRLEECARMPLPAARARLQAIPGVGRWTMAEVGQRALGDPDSPSFGDYHVAKEIGWQLLGHDIDDDGLEELLEPYAGHRFRVQALLALGGGPGRPRRGPRFTLPTHLPTRSF